MERNSPRKELWLRDPWEDETSRQKPGPCLRGNLPQPSEAWGG